jgi:hypothetical protein
VKRAALALAVACAAAGTANADEKCALVVASEPAPNAAALGAARASLASRCRFVSDPELLATLERFVRRPAPEERGREALARAHARLRHFDAAGARRALDEAWAAAGEMHPTTEARDLAAQVRVQEAELGLVQNESAAGVRAMRLALAAAAPRLVLDEARLSPPLLALLTRARSELAHAKPVGVSVTSQPPGARVWAAGSWRGETPLSLELPEGPNLVWLVRDDFRPYALAFEAGAGQAAAAATLVPTDPAERLRPLVDAVRQTSGGARKEAASALARALDVDALLVVETGSSPELYARSEAATPAPVSLRRDAALPLQLRAAAPPRRPWYKKPWPWIAIVGGTAVAATAVTLGVTFGTSTVTTITCCR